MKKKKKLLAIGLAFGMIASLAACGSGETTKVPGDEGEVKTQADSSQTSQEGEKTDKEWLHVGELPLVEEGTDKTLTIAVCMNEVSGNPEDMWMYKFIEDAMNIDIKVTKFTDANKNEMLSLMFADDDLPDIIIGGNFTGTDLVNYGANEGQIIDLDPYITKENMPNLYTIYEEHPEFKDVVSTPDGRIWSLGAIRDPYDKGQVSRAFLNYDWLEEAGLEAPTTLDGFLDAMRAFKKRGDNIVPMGGCYAAYDPTLIILNAYGYLTSDAKGLTICRRDGEIVLPVADRKVFGEYLKTMNQIYEEGLIVSEFYTMDQATAKAIIAEGRTGFIANAPFVFSTDIVSQFWGAYPLTSDYHSEQVWPAGTKAVSSGQFVVTSACEEVELAVAFADFFYSLDGYGYNIAQVGPSIHDTEYLYDGMKGYEYRFGEDGIVNNMVHLEMEENPELYSNVNDFRYKKIMLWGYNVFGYGPENTILQEKYGLKENQYVKPYSVQLKMLEESEKSSELRKELTGEAHFRTAMYDTTVPYAELPLSTAFLSPEEADEAAKLEVLLKEYASQEIAKFVTGVRSLNGLDEYFDELERLGSEEYVNIYKEYYGNVQ